MSIETKSTMKSQDSNKMTSRASSVARMRSFMLAISNASFATMRSLCRHCFNRNAQTNVNCAKSACILKQYHSLRYNEQQILYVFVEDKFQRILLRNVLIQDSKPDLRDSLFHAAQTKTINSSGVHTLDVRKR